MKNNAKMKSRGTNITSFGTGLMSMGYLEHKSTIMNIFQSRLYIYLISYYKKIEVETFETNP